MGGLFDLRFFWMEVGERTSTGPDLVKGHIKEGGIDTEVSSHSLEPAKELSRHTTTTSRV